MLIEQIMLQDRKPIGRHIQDGPVADVEHQVENQINYIREVMARATTFTAVPGRGMIGMGLVAVLAAGYGALNLVPPSWIVAWLVAVVIAPLVGCGALIAKAKHTGESFQSGVGRKFIMSFLPSLFVGFLISIGLWHTGQVSLMPGVWMLLYGVGTIAGGAYSVRIIPIMGICFLVFGTIALFLPLAWGNLLMAISFGGLHILFGFIIAVKYGG